MTTKEQEKAARYIAQLEQARCTAQWDQIPELTRKVLKHAPQRKCLVLTAQTESQVANYEPSNERPSTAGTTGSVTTSTLAKLIPPLLAAIEDEQTYAEDAFQATVCLGWIHWVLHEPQLAIARLPKDIAHEVNNVTNGLPPQQKYGSWLAVCAVKAAYIKGFSQEKTLGPLEGLETYTSMLPFLLEHPLTLGSYNPELRLWAERLLSRMVAVAMKSKPLGEWMELEKMLQMFHLWISLFKVSSTSGSKDPHIRVPPSMIELGSEVDYSRWDVWMSYYDTLSEILLRGYIYAPTYSDKKPDLVFTPDGMDETQYLASRLRQRSELKQVEASIETKLLEETRFPKSTERNSRVERWVDAVMQNWRILCGPSWTDDELGEGGKDAIARGVLDILYRAATKSFHSTQILRYLFNVHAYVAEFDLAFKAFDTYVELVQKGKDREDKTGEPDYSLDNDDTTLHTVSSAIRLLCRYGDRKDVEKSRDVAQKLQVWLQRATAEAEAQESADHTASVPVHVPVSPQSVAEAYTALGICEATWARLTYDAPSRNVHQQKAVDLFKTSLKVAFGNEPDLDTSFQLALVLAETRELSPAIKVVKQAMSRPARGDFLSPLTNNGSTNSMQRSESTNYIRERKLVPFWHLLTLLLTAKSDLPTAARTSNAAFEQFEDYSVLFGPQSNFKSEHLQELELTEKEGASRPKGLVDRMNLYEKEGIIQVKVTQIALKEELQNATDAVESSAELLALYARLFGDPRAEAKTTSKINTSRAPKSAVGSLRQSVFSRIGRSRSRHGEERRESVPSVPSVPGTRQPSIATTNAPTIQVTNEDGSMSRSQSKSGFGRSRSQHSVARSKSHAGTSTPRRSTSHGRLQKRSESQSRKSVESMPRQSTEQVQNGMATSVDYPVVAVSSKNSPPVGSENKVSNFSLPRPPTTSADSPSPIQFLKDVANSLDPISEPFPSGKSDQIPKQNLRPPVPHSSMVNMTPEPLFPFVQERRHKMSLLVELWLFIAGLYTRAGVYDDAKAAVEEAAELVGEMEADFPKEDSGAKTFATKGWGGGKSVEELWGDVWTARGNLFAAQEQPYDAMAQFEKALSHFPDHPTAIVGLSEILLDIATSKIPPEAPEPPLFPDTSSATPKSSAAAPPTNAPSTSPEELNRLAARDRAYGLLSSLTKLGTGWDYSEAWFALAKCYEMSGQVEKAKEVLWWCVELEDTRPIRAWSCVKAMGQ
ncbi:uncharacterized protein PV09_00183 [Verruconis gallopava]|uniref:Filamentation protein n=1 Tax=Verruconis gallopava TaxID=253628 RepID=A0A0D1Y2I0_9PEZI|nr:uncharacterized protein PV09_00183 [Verruconis gallopava]KIW09261.1 hypothetical protein PV09_00183 [Verruconis gallopava]